VNRLQRGMNVQLIFENPKKAAGLILRNTPYNKNNNIIT